MTDLGAWLRSLGLARYESAFRDNDVGADVLPELTADDLREIGVASVGDRRRLLAAIAAMAAVRRQPAADGAKLQAGPAAAAPAEEADNAAAERRLLTVLFCDLAGSTALSAHLDPEDLREVITAYHRAVSETVERHGGYVAKFLGDGVLAYFGWPEAHEDDAERAVRTGLAACAAVSRLVIGTGPLAARAGIATGSVVVGDVVGEGAARERGVVGETPNLAARLQAMAEPGGVVLDGATRQLTGALFEWADIGEADLKGLPHPVRAWRAVREGSVDSRSEALHVGGTLAPLVGRDEQLQLLLRRWEQAAAGEGQVVLLGGEPGIGKSRLVAALQDRLAGVPHELLLWFCSPHHADSALHPIIARLERAAGFAREDEHGARLTRLEALLAPDGPTREEIALIADLLGLPPRAGRTSPELSPQQYRARILAALLRRTEALTRRRPLLAVLEDAHWADPTTRELLDMLVGAAPGIRMLLVVAHRPEFQPPWVGEATVTVLRVNRLGPREAAALIAGVAGAEALPAHLTQEILERSDGVPLFAEELTRAVLEAGSGAAAEGTLAAVPPAGAQAVPATLQASLLARLDRLGPAAKEAAQAGAAIGRDFPHDLLAGAAGLPEPALHEAVARLVASGLVSARGIPPEATYSFKHALVRDAAYGMLLRGRRRELHERIGRALERHHDETTERLPEILARHFTEAGLATDAVGYWLKAGQRAAAGSANAEAKSHLQRGLALLPQLSDAALRRSTEFELQCALGPALNAILGYAARETVAAYERARELLPPEGGAAGRDVIFTGLYVAHYNRGEFRKGFALGQEFLAWAERQSETAPHCIAHRMLAAVYNVMGDHRAARHHAGQALGYYDPEQHAPLAWRYAHDIGVGARAHVAMPAWHMGEVSLATRLEREALATATELRHANTLGYALFYAGVLPAFARRDPVALADYAERLRVHGHDHALPQWAPWATCFGASALTAGGRPGDALECLRHGGAMCDAISNHAFRPAFCFIKAEALLAAGDAGKALKAVAQGMLEADGSGETWLDAELLRLRGEATLNLPGHCRAEEAETSLRAAVARAEEQGSRIFGLRALTSLARLLRHRGHAGAACDLLAPVYASFGEGFELPDFVEARGLLEELGAAVAHAQMHVPGKAQAAGDPDAQTGTVNLLD